MLLTITIFELSSKQTYMEKDPPNNAIYALLLSKAYSPWELGGFGGLGRTWRHLEAPYTPRFFCLALASSPNSRVREHTPGSSGNHWVTGQVLTLD